MGVLGCRRAGGGIRIVQSRTSAVARAAASSLAMVSTTISLVCSLRASRRSRSASAAAASSASSASRSLIVSRSACRRHGFLTLAPAAVIRPDPSLAMVLSAESDSWQL